jgi:hypothetical protein
MYLLPGKDMSVDSKKEGKLMEKRPNTGAK